MTLNAYTITRVTCTPGNKKLVLSMLPSLSRLSTQPTSGFVFDDSDDQRSARLMCSIVNAANLYYGTDDNERTLGCIHEELRHGAQSCEFYESAMSVAIMGCAPSCEHLLTVIATAALCDGAYDAVASATLRAAHLRNRKFYRALFNCVHKSQCKDFDTDALVQRMYALARSLKISCRCVSVMQRLPILLITYHKTKPQTPAQRLRHVEEAIETMKREHKSELDELEAEKARLEKENLAQKSTTEEDPSEGGLRA